MKAKEISVIERSANGDIKQEAAELGVVIYNNVCPVRIGIDHSAGFDPGEVTAVTVHAAWAENLSPSAAKAYADLIQFAAETAAELEAKYKGTIVEIKF